jgi:hypothetical protein
LLGCDRVLMVFWSTGALCARLSEEVAPSLACARGMWERVTCAFPRFLALDCHGFVLSRAPMHWCSGGSCSISPISASNVYVVRLVDVRWLHLRELV